jgi:hypothetical protein
LIGDREHMLGQGLGVRSGGQAHNSGRANGKDDHGGRPPTAAQRGPHDCPGARCPCAHTYAHGHVQRESQVAARCCRAGGDWKRGQPRRTTHKSNALWFWFGPAGSGIHAENDQPSVAEPGVGPSAMSSQPFYQPQPGASAILLVWMEWGIRDWGSARRWWPWAGAQWVGEQQLWGGV